MERVKCKNCNKELSAKMDIHYRDADCEIFCSKDCAVEAYIKEFRVIKVDARNGEHIDEFTLVKDGDVYHSNIEDDGCSKCRDGVLTFSKMIETGGFESELYICDKCGNEFIVNCD